MATKNYYDILGVEKNASKDDIKKAFRKLAQKYHPDKKTGDEAKFKEVSEAYSVLSDEKRRKEYDSYGQTFGGNAEAGGFSGFQGFDSSAFADIDLEDIFGSFGDMFGGGGRRVKRGRDISMDIELSFKDSVFGVKRNVIISKVNVCDECDGNGAKKGTELETCKTCGGAGKIHEARNTIMGTFSTTRECQECGGLGQIPKEKCSKCHGAGVIKGEVDIPLNIPAGINDGEVIRMTGFGEAVRNGVSGDLYIKVHVKPDNIFRKQGIDLVADVPIKLTDALLGTTYTIKTLDGKNIEVKIPKMAKTTETLRVRGKGVQSMQGKGDLLLKVSVTMPKKLGRKESQLIKELKDLGI